MLKTLYSHIEEYQFRLSLFFFRHPNLGTILFVLSLLSALPAAVAISDGRVLLSIIEFVISIIFIIYVYITTIG